MSEQAKNYQPADIVADELESTGNVAAITAFNDIRARLSDAETERDQWKATAETLGDAEVMADLRAADAEELGSNETGAKPGGEGLSTPLPSLSDEGLVAKLFAAEARAEALEAECERLKTRGGIALSLIPAARVAKFHERCEALGLARAAPSAGQKEQQ